jgi:hypothetical protein
LNRNNKPSRKLQKREAHTQICVNYRENYKADTQSSKTAVPLPCRALLCPVASSDD